MAVPVARVHLKMAHAALPALLPTPPKWKMLPVLRMPCVAAVLPKPLANAKPSHADSVERWDARKTKPGHGSSPHKNATSPPPKPGRADTAERWDAHKKAVVPASSSSSSGTSALVTSTCKISRASSSCERSDVHKKHCPPQAEQLDDGESSSSTGSNNIDDMEEEIVWKPRAMYAGPGYAVTTPPPSMIPLPTTFLVRVA